MKKKVLLTENAVHVGGRDDLLLVDGRGRRQMAESFGEGRKLKHALNKAIFSRKMTVWNLIVHIFLDNTK